MHEEQQGYQDDDRRTNLDRRHSCLAHSANVSRIDRLEHDYKDHIEDYERICGDIVALTVEQARFRTLFRFASWLFGIFLMILITISTASFVYTVKFQDKHLELHKQMVSEMEEHIKEQIDMYHPPP